jgi:Leucine-rich repeat (LRR) protein
VTILQFQDPIMDNTIKIGVPRFMQLYSGSRIADELHYYLRNSNHWSQRMILELLFYSLTYGTDYEPINETYPEYPCLRSRSNWMDNTVDVCEWEGITCGEVYPSRHEQPRAEWKLFGNAEEGTTFSYPSKPTDSIWPPLSAVTQIDVSNMDCQGTIPENLIMLTDLRRLTIRDNHLKGTIPATFGQWSTLQFLDLSFNKLTGVPWQISQLGKTLEELWLNDNQLGGPIHFYLSAIRSMKKLIWLDLSQNQISGTIPTDLTCLANLVGLFLDNNQISGTIPSEIGTTLKSMEYIFLQNNKLYGTIPSEFGQLSLLQAILMQENRLTGTIPSELTNLKYLEELNMANNQISGTLPGGDLSKCDRKGFSWSTMRHLSRLDLNTNKLEGVLPVPFLIGLSKSLKLLNLAFNNLSGSLPPELARMKELNDLSLAYNALTGTIPFEMGRMTQLHSLNLTSNRLRGTIPSGLSCGINGPRISKRFGSDAVLCPPGYYHPHGAADNFGACRPCPSKSGKSVVAKFLGQTSCPDVTFVVGDVNGDGLLSHREILQFLYFQNDGYMWGDKFGDWLDTSIPDCELPGVSCTGSVITKLDLSDAMICADENGEDGLEEDCLGIPAELFLLSTLTSLSLPRRNFLRGTLPTEIGLLEHLQHLDLSYCPKLKGTIPIEIGKLSNLESLNLMHSGFSGTIPSHLFRLKRLKNLYLTANPLTGSIPSEIGLAYNLKELMLSRLLLFGTIPTTIGRLRAIENLEFYGSNLQGSIPSEIGSCLSLKRLDAFNNFLTGTVPSTLAQIEGLQIIHLKKNRLTGRLPEELGNLQFLTWLDISFNLISGTIPMSYGNIRTLRDLRLGGNRIHDPIPTSLCASPQVNGGRTRTYGCDGILCPVGFFDPGGFAFNEVDSCEKCPTGLTTMYLGGTECIELTVEDLLSIFYSVMGGDMWDQNDVRNWRSGRYICQWYVRMFPSQWTFPLVSYWNSNWMYLFYRKGMVLLAMKKELQYRYRFP